MGEKKTKGKKERKRIEKKGGRNKYKSVGVSEAAVFVFLTISLFDTRPNNDSSKMREKQKREGDEKQKREGDEGTAAYCSRTRLVG